MNIKGTICVEKCTVSPGMCGETSPLSGTFAECRFQSTHFKGSVPCLSLNFSFLASVWE